MTVILSELTIVIATLPKKYPPQWIDQIKSYVSAGVIIIIVIPPGYSLVNFPDDFQNNNAIQIEVSDMKGQVSQRIYGFSKATTNYVMQMDDDIYLEISDLKQLLDIFTRLGDNSVIAPRLSSSEKERSLQRNPDWRSFQGIYRNFYAHFLHGIPWFRSSYGVATKSGFGYTYPSYIYSRNVVSSEWLPGGCILHRRENLILESFYPFHGKAYVEDLIHSYYLKKRGLKLWYFLPVLAFTQPPEDINLVEDPAEIFQDFKARKYYVELFKGSLVRMKIIYGIKAILLGLSLFWSILKD